MSEQRREFFRVEYPSGYRPRFIVKGQSFDILDISECGIRFLLVDNANFIIGASIKGIVHFTDDEELECSGIVIRKELGTVAIQNDVAIPLARIRSEHLNLIRNFYSKYD
ncbi:MAG TPA: PilZ domain-containing protein [Gammaproteobacteria bacterium]